jgi:hypothetical protein
LDWHSNFAIYGGLAKANFSIFQVAAWFSYDMVAVSLLLVWVVVPFIFMNARWQLFLYGRYVHMITLFHSSWSVGVSLLLSLCHESWGFYRSWCLCGMHISH